MDYIQYTLKSAYFIATMKRTPLIVIKQMQILKTCYTFDLNSIGDTMPFQLR